MKRAAQWLCGRSFPREAHLEDVVRRFRKDETGVVKDLLQLRSFQKQGTAKAQVDALLQHLSSKSLSDEDAQWMDIFGIVSSEGDLTANDKAKLAMLMMKKRQFDYVAERFKELLVSDVLDEFETQDLEDLYEATKARQAQDAVAAPRKLRRVTSERRQESESNPPSSAYAVGLKLAERLELVQEPQLRDLLVELYEMHPDPCHIQRLATWFRAHHSDQDAAWAQATHLGALEALLRLCVQEAAGATGPFRESLGQMALVAGKRHEELARPHAAAEKLACLLRAAEAFRCGLRADPSHRGVQSRLLDVLVACYAETPEVDKAEVVQLMAATGNYAQLVADFESFSAAVEAALGSWQEEQVQEAANLLETSGKRCEAGTMHLKFAQLMEEKGFKKKAFSNYGLAFKLNSEDTISEEGVLRLAVDVDCVEYAVEAVLRPVIPSSASYKMVSLFAMIKEYIDKRLADAQIGPQGAGPGAALAAASPEPFRREAPTTTASAPSPPNYDSLLENLCGDDSQPGDSPASQHLAMPGTPLSLDYSKATRLREKWPDRIPVMIQPAMNPMNPGFDPNVAPLKFLVQQNATCADLKRSLHKYLEKWSDDRKKLVLGSASELGRPVAQREAIRLLDERNDTECLQLRFTLDRIAEDRWRVELFDLIRP